MACYVLTINNCGKLQEGSNGGVDWMFPQFHAIKETIVSFTVHKMLQGCVGKVGKFKRSDVIGTSICSGSVDNMVLNPTVDVFSAITSGGWYLREDNCILLYLNAFKHCLYAERELQVARDAEASIYPPNISDFLDDNNRQIVTNLASVLLNTQVKELKHDGHFRTFINIMLALLLYHNGFLKISS